MEKGFNNKKNKKNSKYESKNNLYDIGEIIFIVEKKNQINNNG